MDWQAIWLSVRLSVSTTAILLAVGTPLAAWLAFSRWRWKFLVEAVVALPLGINFVSSSTRRTRSAVSGRTRLDPLMTRETVALETPAIFAIPRISIVLFPSPFQVS